MKANQNIFLLSYCISAIYNTFYLVISANRLLNGSQMHDIRTVDILKKGLFEECETFSECDKKPWHSPEPVNSC